MDLDSICRCAVILAKFFVCAREQFLSWGRLEDGVSLYLYLDRD
jgi:hypothetical protein